MLQTTVNNLVVDDGNEEELKQYIGNMLLQEEWWTEGYYFLYDEVVSIFKTMTSSLFLEDGVSFWLYSKTIV